MKLIELIPNQRVIVQLAWGEQKIEFYASVLERDSTSVYVTPYIHNGSVLELNITRDKGVTCNLFADNLNTKQRISWRGIELTTVNRNNNITYCLTTYAFNSVGNLDDRRVNERVVVEVDGVMVEDNDGTEENITIRDISDTGLSFYVAGTFEPKSQQITVSFSDIVEGREFDISVECAVSRVSTEGDRSVVGCKLTSTNKNYQIYGLIRRLMNRA